MDGGDPVRPAGDPDRELSKERLRAWLRLLKVTRRIEAAIRSRMRTEFNTTLPRFDVLAALDRFPDGLRMSELSGLLRVSNGNVTGVVDRLVGEGLVERHAVAGDRRAQLVRLTGRGRAAFAEMARRHEAWVNELMSGLDAPTARALGEALGRVGAGG
ncbi:MAG: MarR family transcriptional regulator [Alphaproteobacteria bacterium]|nr:MAG: MarR family transcriptional regulator [Alphaproteobacteria bacterium]